MSRPRLLHYYIWYWSKNLGKFYESTSVLDKRCVESTRESYRRCGWCTAVEKRWQ